MGQQDNSFLAGAGIITLIVFGWNPIFWILLVAVGIVWLINKFDGGNNG